VLLLLLVALDLGDGLALGEALGIAHLLLTEVNLPGLLTLLRLDVLLELRDGLFDVGVGVAKDFNILLETAFTGKNFVILERLATVLEQVDSVLDVSLGE